jgi:hypothetical protein
VTTLLEEQMTEATADPLDTHPPLSERLSALGWYDAPPASGAEEPAIGLIAHPETMEERLLAHILPRNVSAALQPTAWADLGELVLLPTWRELVAGNTSRLTSLRADDLPSLASPAGALAVSLQLAASPSVASERHIQEARYLVGAAVAIALYNRGFRFSAQLGEPVVFSVGPIVVHPFRLMADFLDNAVSADGWAAVLREGRMEGLTLGELPLPGDAQNDA